MQRRQKADADSVAGGGDVESQTSSDRPVSPRRLPSGGGAHSGGGSLLRKLMLLTARDVAENSQGNYLITIIKDVISGTILGVFFLMILIFLDYRNIVQLGSARAFRRAAFELMTDPETVKSIEENIDVKFIPIDVYKSMSEEIERNRDKVKDNTGLKQHEEDLKKKTEEIESMKAEYEEVKAKGDKLLGLDKWCGSCKGGWGKCDGRVKYLSDTYHTPEIKAKVEIMSKGTCVK